MGTHIRNNLALLCGVIGLLLIVFGQVQSCSRAHGQSIPTPPQPEGGPVTAERVALGRALFFDPRLSIDGSVSCSTCHDPMHGFAEPRPVSVGVGGRTGNRNAPTIVNAVYSPLQFWDGNTIGVARQALAPLVNPVEMRNQSDEQVCNRLNRIAGYRSRFRAAYGGLATPSRLGHAMACFEQSILSFDAPIDRRLAGYTRALSPLAEEGFQIFVAANCMACHVYPLMSDYGFHNTGVAVFFDTKEQGRAGFLQGQAKREDIRALKTPTLREIQATAPYTHAGRAGTLTEVVAGYNVGWRNGRRVDNVQDERIKPLGLDARQQAALVEFLSTAFASPRYPRVTAPGLPR